MRRDHRPFWLKKAMDQLNEAYCRRVVYPQFDSLGPGANIKNPRCLVLMGPRIRAGSHLHMVATRDGPISLVVWPETGGRIDIGNFVALSPGVRIKSACHVEIGDGALIAEGVFITDADWHDFYDRIYPPGPMAPVRLEENVWLADGVIVCKGVTIGRNSVVGTGSVVTSDIPPNVVAAGNPARPIRELDPNARFVSRQSMFDGAESFERFEERITRGYLEQNTLSGWLRSILAPTRDS